MDNDTLRFEDPAAGRELNPTRCASSLPSALSERRNRTDSLEGAATLWLWPGRSVRLDRKRCRSISFDRSWNHPGRTGIAVTGRGSATIGAFTLNGRLGSNVLGDLFFAHSADGRFAAVRLVHAHLAADDKYRAQVMAVFTKARTVIRDFVASVLDVDVDVSRPWLATEYLGGCRCAMWSPSADHCHRRSSTPSRRRSFARPRGGRAGRSMTKPSFGISDGQLRCLTRML